MGRLESETTYSYVDYLTWETDAYAEALYGQFISMLALSIWNRMSSKWLPHNVARSPRYFVECLRSVAQHSRIVA